MNEDIRKITTEKANGYGGELNDDQLIKVSGGALSEGDLCITFCERCKKNTTHIVRIGIGAICRSCGMPRKIPGDGEYLLPLI